MKEITRIHIAKIPYDIELSAKNDIEKYIKNLEIYADDKELLQDIEIRITELLADRGVNANGVIAADDVTSIREQLGEPKDFLGEDKEIAQVINVNESTERKLFRNTDSAVLGGVLSGIASYFKVNSIWIRLIFIAMLFFSAGTVLLAYVILWIVIPPAKSATEKLQMSGRPVTLDSIRELNENGQSLIIEHERASAVRRIVMLIVGIFLLGASITTLIFTIFVAFGIGHYNVFNGVVSGAQWVFVMAYMLAVVAGVLLSALFAVCAYIAFSLNVNKRIIISVVGIVIAGLLSFGTAVGLVSYQSLQVESQMRRDTKDTIISNPTGFSEIKNIIVDVKSVHVKYIVDNNYRIEFHSLSEDKQPDISINNTTMNVKFLYDQSARWPQLQPTLTVYGPELDLIKVTQGDVSYSGNKQDMKVETSGRNSSIELVSGVFGNLKIDAKDSSLVSADKSTVESVVINSLTGSDVELGTVKALDITQPEACPVNVDANVDVRNVSSGVMRYNGSEIKASSYDSNCGSITFGNNN